MSELLANLIKYIYFESYDSCIHVVIGFSFSIECGISIKILCNNYVFLGIKHRIDKPSEPSDFNEPYGIFGLKNI